MSIPNTNITSNMKVYLFLGIIVLLCLFVFTSQGQSKGNRNEYGYEERGRGREGSLISYKSTSVSAPMAMMDMGGYQDNTESMSTNRKMMMETPQSDGNEQISDQVPDRMIIKNAAINIVSAKIKETETKISDFVLKRKGFIVSNNWNSGSSSLSVRVPFNQFEETLKYIREVSDSVEYESSSGTDVTEQYVDQKARLENMESVHKRFLNLLEKATDVKDILALEKELVTVTERLESYKARISYLEKSSSTSLININIREPYSYPPPYYWSPFNTLQSALRDVRSWLENSVDFFIYVLVFSVPICCMILVCSPFLRILFLKVSSIFRSEKKDHN